MKKNSLHIVWMPINMALQNRSKATYLKIKSEKSAEKILSKLEKGYIKAAIWTDNKGIESPLIYSNIPR